MSLDDEITDEEMDARRGASQPWCSKCEKYEEDCTCQDDDELEREHMEKMLKHGLDWINDNAGGTNVDKA